MLMESNRVLISVADNVHIEIECDRTFIRRPHMPEIKLALESLLGKEEIGNKLDIEAVQFYLRPKTTSHAVKHSHG